MPLFNSNKNATMGLSKTQNDSCIFFNEQQHMFSYCVYNEVWNMSSNCCCIHPIKLNVYTWVFYIGLKPSSWVISLCEIPLHLKCVFLWKNHAFQRRTDSESCKNEYAALKSYLENVIKICTCAICMCVLWKMIIVTK